MKPWERISISDAGNMVFGGCDCIELAKEYGTPLYVLDEQAVREVCRGFVSALRGANAKGRVYYASKALCTTALYRIVEEEGLGIDVVSGGELFTAKNAGFPGERIVFHGNNKTPDELKMAVEYGVGCIVIDSHEEIGVLADIARECGKTVDVSLRVKPGIEAHTHEFVLTAIDDCKFGLGIYDGEARLAVMEILSRKELRLTGLHCHIGSQIFEKEPFFIAADRLTDFAKEISEELGATISEISLGGGFGIMYTEKDAEGEPFAFVREMIEALYQNCDKKGLPRYDFAIEPGRAIVGEAGITLYTVGTVKRIPGVRTYVSVDGGMGDNPRHILYGSEYTAKIANKPAEEATEVYAIAGRYCESGDMLIKEARLPPCEAGDILAVFSTGAYNYSMASNYNRVPIPAMVLVNEGKHALIVRRQGYEQLIENDRVAPWQK
ncbi:MAG: diaminopimelate decarboxylase [Christensenellales bacterium]|jgi:diaminopimelate decarboxylase